MRYIFGHNPTTPNEYETKDEALHYLRTELPNQANFRYRTTYKPSGVDSIIFSYGGELLAELIVAQIENPTDEERANYPQVQKVYLITEIRIFQNLTVKAGDVGLTHIQFGKQVSDTVYAQILDKVGGIGQVIPPVALSHVQEASDLAEPSAERVLTTTYRVLRDTKLARETKAKYHFECQICGHTIRLTDGSLYAEAHHIQPLGAPHNGPDEVDNILCLCPNHHAELDLGAFALSLTLLRQCDGHTINPKYLAYHNRVIHKQRGHR